MNINNNNNDYYDYYEKKMSIIALLNAFMGQWLMWLYLCRAVLIKAHSIFIIPAAPVHVCNSVGVGVFSKITM